MNTTSLIPSESATASERPIMEKYNEFDLHMRQFVKKHPFAVMGLALAAGFITHAVVEKILDHSKPNSR